MRGPYWKIIGPRSQQYGTDQKHTGPYKNDQELIFSQDGPKKAWLIRDLFHDWNYMKILKSDPAESWSSNQRILDQ